MYVLTQLKQGASLILILLLGLAVLPVQAVNPPPDGGYPGGNTAEGIAALQDLTTGTFNTAVGNFSLTLTTGGELNTGVGASALRSNTTGSENTAVGADALNRNGNGSSNTAIGVRALFHNATGNNNTAVGWYSLQSAKTAKDNTAIGAGALRSNSADGNTAVGSAALNSNSTAVDNTAVGALALLYNNADGNTAVGSAALYSHVRGDYNTAIGTETLFDNTTGSSNTAVGTAALGANTGSGNTALGKGALVFNILGDNNIAVGVDAGKLTHGSNNIVIGNDGVGRDANTIRIGTPFDPNGEIGQNKTFIAGIVGTAVTGSVVLVNGSGQLGTMPSSARFKDDIKPMNKTSKAILALRPVTFHYKKELDQQRIPQFGLVAEEVEKVNPDLVVRDREGTSYTVRYEAVNAMLLNEFLEEHKKVEQQQAVISQLQSTVAKQEANAARQQKQIEALTAGLQKVSAQLATTRPSRGRLELARTVPQMVLNDQ